MPYLYGQLLNAQLENSAGNPSAGGTPMGRVYIDTTSASAAAPKFYNGTAWTTFWQGDAWISYTPAVSFTGGSGNGSNSVVGFYRLQGKTLFLRCQGVITFGSVPSATNFSLPISLAAASGTVQVMAGRNTTHGNMLQCLANAGTTVSLISYDNGNALNATGDQVEFSGCIEVS